MKEYRWVKVPRNFAATHESVPPEVWAGQEFLFVTHQEQLRKRIDNYEDSYIYQCWSSDDPRIINGRHDGRPVLATVILDGSAMKRMRVQEPREKQQAEEIPF